MLDNFFQRNGWINTLKAKNPFSYSDFKMLLIQTGVLTIPPEAHIPVSEGNKFMSSS